MMHFCWSSCCDLGPHACICGNDCEEPGEVAPYKCLHDPVCRDWWDGYYSPAHSARCAAANARDEFPDDMEQAGALHPEFYVIGSPADPKDEQ